MSQPLCKYKGCNSPYIYSSGHKAEGYCAPHAQALGLLSEAEIKLKNMKKSAGQKKKHKERKEVTEDILNRKLSPVESKRERSNLAKAKESYHAIMGDMDFDLKETWEEAKDMGVEGLGTDNLPRSLLLWWWVSDPGTRNPTTVNEVAKVLGKKRLTILRWINDDRFLADIEKSRFRTAKLIGPYIDRRNAILALSGDKKAIDTWYKNYGGVDFSADTPDDFIVELGKNRDIIEEGIEISKGKNKEGFVQIDKKHDDVLHNVDEELSDFEE